MPRDRASLRKSEQRLEVGGHPRGKGAAVQAASACASLSRGPARTPYVCFRSVGLRSLLTCTLHRVVHLKERNQRLGGQGVVPG